MNMILSVTSILDLPLFLWVSTKGKFPSVSIPQFSHL